MSLKEYKERHGDCLVSQKYAPNPPLLGWFKLQRQAYKRKLNGKPTGLIKERVCLLNKLGFVWFIQNDAKSH